MSRLMIICLLPVFLLAADAVATDTDQCPDNESWNPCLPCTPDTCGINKKTYNCPIQTTVCRPGCQCAPGYCRDENKQCVEEKSSSEEQCPVNEYLDTCISCIPDTCGVNNETYQCPIGPAVCRTGCHCNPGFCRKDGQCVPNEEVCPANEVWSTCRPCIPDSCGINKKTYKCPIGPAVCRTGCICAPGYCRNKFNKCVPANRCNRELKCKRKNEVPDCRKPSCKSDFCISIVARFACGNETCKTGCYCKSGFYRQSEGDPCKPYCNCKEVMNTLECKKPVVIECEPDD